MNTVDTMQKLRVKVAYLWGLGIGVTVTAVQLTPTTSQSGDAYMITTILGIAILVLAGVMTWIVRRREISVYKDVNTDKLFEKPKL